MTQIASRIQGEFYPLQQEEWLRAWEELKPAEIKVLFYLRSIDPFGEKELDFGIAALAQKNQLSKSTVSVALRKLADQGWIEFGLLKVAEYGDVERQIRDRLQSELGGQSEVSTAVGRIDLLTKDEVIEIKNIRYWKGALGQILAYSAFFPEHSKRIHLFGRLDLAKLALAIKTCSEFGITVTFEEAY